ncbi:unnamed protein product [Pseudo-nitzschia multistriata]|uniref:Sulfotransferase domain-containing protein n=1 Tax=Pseudo-nitzschia multistriata TaxID=183589 RepID=A0A448YWD0_9STRA|nr:unnamed protein product [Pseudo-nitzschia multistriata]
MKNQTVQKSAPPTTTMKRSNKKRTKPKPNFGLSAAVMLLVVADLVYFFKLSREALFDTPRDLNNAGHHSPYNLFSNGNHLSKLGNRLASIRNTNTQDKDTTENEANENKAPTTKENLSRRAPTAEQSKLIEIAKKRGLTNIDDKGPILEILTQAGLDLHKEGDVDQETMDQLPTWTQVEQLYGPTPKIIGLERCGEFRDSVDPSTRFLAMAGTFNTGTNLIHAVMKHNCQITERMEVYGAKSKGIRWQVPWGKHWMARYRDSEHSTKTDADVPRSNTLPLVSIRDPYTWMQSMCRHGYAAKWPHIKSHCPGLIATENDINTMPRLRRLYGHIHNEDENVEKLIPVNIAYNKNLTHSHLSLAHWYSEWYKDYLTADIPRIMVRFEDLLFHGEEVARTMCECGGGVPVPDNGRSGKFIHISESAKTGLAAHGPLKDRTNLVGALIKYGSGAHRIDSMTQADLEAARRYLDPEMMETFGYKHPRLPDQQPEDAQEMSANAMENVPTESGRYDDDHSYTPGK